MRSKVFKMSGPNFNKVLKKIANKNIDMIRQPLKESSTKLKQQARSLSPVVSGEFRKSIKKKTEISKRNYIARSKIGVAANTKANFYASKVEKKHLIFKRLELQQRKPVISLFKMRINKYWNNQRIK